SNQTPSEKISGLLETLESPEPFIQITPERIAAAKQNLLEKMEELDRQLARQGESNAEAWKAYLLWDDLTDAVEAESPNRTRLNQAGHLFQMNHPGLELKVFTDVRSALFDYANLSYFGSEKIGQKIYESRLNLVKQSLVKLQSEIDDRTIGLIGEAVTDLENSGQCNNLVSAIREVFSEPNFHVQISEKLAKAIVNKQMTSDSRTINEEILGVRQKGTAHTTAKFDIDFIPSTRSGKFKIRIDGNTVSDQVGTKDLGPLGCVYICSEGQTSLVAEAVIGYDGRTISYSGLKTGAQTSTKIKGVESPPLLRNATLKKIEKQKSQGEAEAAERARAKFVRQIRSQLDESLGNVNSRIKNKISKTTRRLNFEPKRLEVATTKDFLEIFALVGNAKQLSGLQGPAVSSKSDVVLQFHESTINNAMQHLFGGKNISNEDLRELISSFGIQLPEPEKDEKPLTISFPRVRPIQVSFADGKITTSITANRIQQDATVVRDKMRIIVSYDVKSSDHSIVIARNEDVKIDFDGAYTNSKSIIESNIKPKLEKLLKRQATEISLKQLELPEEIKSVGLPAFSKIELNAGWFTAELNLKEPPVTANQVPVKKLSRVPDVEQSGTLASIRNVTDFPQLRQKNSVAANRKFSQSGF
ncbi:MAG: hypothetical protein VX438_10225, partial [Planctomycetota bacterium]|nr:hypothetical protein [Planctomycetota bacterium]